MNRETHVIWKNPCREDAGNPAGSPSLTLSRWQSGDLRDINLLNVPASNFLFSICLKATKLAFNTGVGSTFDGLMQGGAVHLTASSQDLAIRTAGPCDLLFLQTPAGFLYDRLVGMGVCGEMLDRFDGRILNDILVENLARLLITDEAGSDQVYTMAVVQTLITRILHLARTKPVAGALAKWRLRKVLALIEAKFADPLTLHDLAAAAGLSRMHFAAQFRAATGTSPHEYLTRHRIEDAKRLLAKTHIPLAEIALTVGFQAQAHFTTVFKRLTGTTPAQWRCACRELAAATSCHSTSAVTQPYTSQGAHP